MPNVGDTIGEKYRLLGRLGEGGMSEVFCAENVWMARRVAIKTLLPGLTRSDRIVQRFWQEARIASQIDHPNIARVLDIGIDPTYQIPYIVQELLEGESLRDHLKDRTGGRVPPDEALALMGPMLRALDAVHQQNIVHRDLKPGNIYLVHGKGGTIVPKLIDFGISKILAEADADGINTRTGVPLGTPLYMAPEQAAGLKDVDAQADVWSMGVVLYEMLAGRCPFEGDNHNVIIAKILRDRPTRIEELAPDLSRSLAAIVHRAVEPDRTRRFASASAFLDALEEFEAGGAEDEDQTSVLNAGSVSPVHALMMPSSPAHATAITPVQWNEVVPPQPPASPNRTLLPAVGALLLVGLSALALVLSLRARVGQEVHPIGAPPPSGHLSAGLAPEPLPPSAAGTIAARTASGAVSQDAGVGDGIAPERRVRDLRAPQRQRPRHPLPVRSHARGLNL